MILKRRGLLGAIGLVMAAPVIARAENLMKISVEKEWLLWGDGIHDDTASIQRLLDWSRQTGKPAMLTPGTFRLTRPLRTQGATLIGAGVGRDNAMLTRLQFDGDTKAMMLNFDNARLVHRMAQAWREGSGKS